jgi:hypothetical protein
VSSAEFSIRPVISSIVCWMTFLDVDIGARTSSSWSRLATACPILAGQFVDRRALEMTPGERALGLGAPLGAGQVAFALPVEPSQAVGAALAPGARVNVIAVANALRTGTGSTTSATPPAAVVLGEGYVILALRTADGQPLTAATNADAGGTRTLVPPKLGSVVIAIPAELQAEFAEADSRRPSTSRSRSRGRAHEIVRTPADPHVRRARCDAGPFAGAAQGRSAH